MKARIAIAVICGLLGLYAVGYWVLPREPVYHGKKLSQWVDEMSSSGSRGPRAEAVEALRAIGPPAFPYMATWLCPAKRSSFSGLLEGLFPDLARASELRPSPDSVVLAGASGRPLRRPSAFLARLGGFEGVDCASNCKSTLRLFRSSLQNRLGRSVLGR